MMQCNTFLGQGLASKKKNESSSLGHTSKQESSWWPQCRGQPRSASRNTWWWTWCLCHLAGPMRVLRTAGRAQTQSGGLYREVSLVVRWSWESNLASFSGHESCPHLPHYLISHTHVSIEKPFVQENCSKLILVLVEASLNQNFRWTV